MPLSNRLRLQGQFQLDILPLGPHENTVLIALSVARAFVGNPTTMPSADFCAAIASLTETLSPGIPDTTQTSRGKTDRLRRTPAESTAPDLDGYGLRGRRHARPAGSASYSVLVHRVAVLLHASFRPRLATAPLRFANPSPPSGWIENFHLQAVNHARHTYSAERVRAHVFPCTLACHVEWHLRRRLAPMLFQDDDPEGARAQRSSPVQSARTSKRSRRKSATGTTAEGLPVHSLPTLLDDLATLTLNAVHLPDNPENGFTVPAQPTPVQRRAFKLLDVDPEKMISVRAQFE